MDEKTKINRNDFLNVRRGGVNDLWNIYTNEAKENPALRNLVDNKFIMPYNDEKKETGITLNSWVNKVIKNLLLHADFELDPSNRLSYNIPTDNDRPERKGRPRTKGSNRTYVCETVYNTRRERDKTKKVIPEQNRICYELGRQQQPQQAQVEVKQESLQEWANRIPNATRKMRELFDSNKDQIDMKDFKEWVGQEQLIPENKKYQPNLVKKDDKLRYLLSRGFNNVRLEGDIYRLYRNGQQGGRGKRKKNK